MDPETLGREYDKIAHHWQEPFLQTNGLAQFEKAIRFAKNRGPALDIGCGSSGRFIDLLSKHGFTPEGLDVSRQMIGLAKKWHPDVKFYEADISKWSFPKKYDFISAWAAHGIYPWKYRNLFYKRFVRGLPTMESLFSPRAG